MTDEPAVDKTALSYWFPKLEAAGLPVPRTKIIEMPYSAMEDAWKGFDGIEGTGALKAFCGEIAAVAAEFGLPVFLRTDHTSNKHEWRHTCYLARAEDVPAHVDALIEFSEICDFIGLPYKNWVIREMLPTIPFGVCRGYGDMPICREFRFFVDDGVIRCSHFYWPHGSLIDGDAVMQGSYEDLCWMGGEVELRALAEAAGRAVPGSWSIDILETRRGWFVTDMAEADRSWHWPGCPHADKVCA